MKKKRTQKKGDEKVKEKLLARDKIDKRKRSRLEVFLEFFVFGLIMGVIEDLIAVKLATGETLTWDIIWIVALVALPFAAIGELLVDRFRLLPLKPKKNKKLKKRDKKKK